MRATFCLFWLCISLGRSALPQRPNILFVFADDLGRHAGAYAKLDGPGSMNDLVRTPHFDRIAREGTLFRHAFVSAPSCTPSRSAILSGQHFWQTGQASILRGARWDGSSPAFPLLLRDAGYHIGETYKVWAPGRPNDGPYSTGKHSFEGAGRRFNQFSRHVSDLVAKGQGLEAAKEVLYAEVRANFDAFLAARNPGQPFCYWFGPTNTHRPWVRGSGKALWGLEPERLQGKLPPFLPDVPEVREDIADYLGEAMAFDAALGILLAKLEAMGELEHTLVVVSGDHGAPGFPHGKCNLYDFGSSVLLGMRWGSKNEGRIVDSPVGLIDLAPTFLEAANVERPAAMVGRSLVSLVAGDGAGGRSTSDAVFIGRERHVENAREGFLPYPQRAIRTRDHLYIINFAPERWPLGEPYRLSDRNAPSEDEVMRDTRATLPDEDAGPTKAWLVARHDDARWQPVFEMAYGKRPREELYDLRSDPHQTRNVAGTENYLAVQIELDGRLMEELRRTKDPRIIDGGRFFETPPMAGPTDDVEPNGGLTPAELRTGKGRDSAKP